MAKNKKKVASLLSRGKRNQSLEKSLLPKNSNPIIALETPLAFQAYTGHESLLLEKTPLAKSLTGGSSPSKYLIHVENASTAQGVDSVSLIQDNVIVEYGSDDRDFEKDQVEYVESERF